MIDAEPAPRGYFQNGTPWCDLTPPAAVEAASPERHIGCLTCHHAERVRIEALHVAGVSLDKLAAQFGIHRDAIHRHCKNHLTERARISYLAGPAAIADLANAAARENRSVLEYLTVIRSVLMQQFTECGGGQGAHRCERRRAPCDGIAGARQDYWRDFRARRRSRLTTMSKF